jgi:sugar lactone lactonase YvrE
VQEFLADPCTTDLYFLGESLRWDEVLGELYWVDLNAGQFFRAHADYSKVEVVDSYTVDGFLTAVAPIENRMEGWIVASNLSISILDGAGGMRELARPEADNGVGVRMNDGACDPWGRFWIGSMALDARIGRGSLYRYHESTGTMKALSGLAISNGLGWSPDWRTMYFVDSGPGIIYTFDVDKHGEISNQRPFVQFDSAIEGTPDGLCVDVDGAVWVAVWGGYEVRRYAPSGELLTRVKIPTAQPTCCAIGGNNGTTLYITTAREDLSPEFLEQEPDAGRLFCVDVKIKGLPLNSYRHGGETWAH